MAFGMQSANVSCSVPFPEGYFITVAGEDPPWWELRRRVGLAAGHGSLRIARAEEDCGTCLEFFVRAACEDAGLPKEFHAGSSQEPLRLVVGSVATCDLGYGGHLTLGEDERTKANVQECWRRRLAMGEAFRVEP
jgi:hypothetical protein